MGKLSALGLLGVVWCSIASAQQDPAEGLSGRWLEIDRFSVGTRVAGSNDGSRAPTGWTLQHQELIEGAFRFDAAGIFSLRGAVADGDNIAGGWRARGAERTPKAALALKRIFGRADTIYGSATEAR